MMAVATYFGRCCREFFFFRLRAYLIPTVRNDSEQQMRTTQPSYIGLRSYGTVER